jgi:hypothetical protein
MSFMNFKLLSSGIDIYVTGRIIGTFIILRDKVKILRHFAVFNLHCRIVVQIVARHYTAWATRLTFQFTRTNITEHNVEINKSADAFFR